MSGAGCSAPRAAPRPTRSQGDREAGQTSARSATGVGRHRVDDDRGRRAGRYLEGDDRKGTASAATIDGEVQPDLGLVRDRGGGLAGDVEVWPGGRPVTGYAGAPMDVCPERGADQRLV